MALSPTQPVSQLTVLPGFINKPFLTKDIWSVVLTHFSKGPNTKDPIALSATCKFFNQFLKTNSHFLKCLHCLYKLNQMPKQKCFYHAQSTELVGPEDRLLTVTESGENLYVGSKTFGLCLMTVSFLNEKNSFSTFGTYLTRDPDLKPIYSAHGTDLSFVIQCHSSDQGFILICESGFSIWKKFMGSLDCVYQDQEFIKKNSRLVQSSAFYRGILFLHVYQKGGEKLLGIDFNSLKLLFEKDMPRGFRLISAGSRLFLLREKENISDLLEITCKPLDDIGAADSFYDLTEFSFQIKDVREFKDCGNRWLICEGKYIQVVDLEKNLIWLDAEHKIEAPNFGTVTIHQNFLILSYKKTHGLRPNEHNSIRVIHLPTKTDYTEKLKAMLVLANPTQHFVSLALNVDPKQGPTLVALFSSLGVNGQSTQMEEVHFFLDDVEEGVCLTSQIPQKLTEKKEDEKNYTILEVAKKGLAYMSRFFNL